MITNSVIRPSLQRVALAVVLAMLVSVLGFTSPASAEPSLLNVRRGTIGDGQGLDSLASQEHSGTQDNWLNYVEFTPDSGRHISVIDVEPAGGGDDLLIEANYRGPTADENRWTLRVRDFDARTWVEVFRNDSVDDWTWTEVSAELDDASRFIRNGRLRFVYTSSNAVDVSQLDHLAATLSDATPVEPPVDPPTPGGGEFALPPADGAFDYQINGSYEPASDVEVISRDWFVSSADPDLYSICYVNAFQTQPDYDIGRPDETSQWPALVVTDLEDPNWPGEFLIDISSETARITAASHMEQILDTCAAKGYDAIEFDNLDSWTRTTTGTGPWWDGDDAAAYARLLTDYTHSLGLAAAQKNSAELFDQDRHVTAGFDFAVSENCGQWNECQDYVDQYGSFVYDIEYTDGGFATACEMDEVVSVVRRDLNVEPTGATGHVYRVC